MKSCLSPEHVSVAVHVEASPLRRNSHLAVIVGYLGHQNLQYNSHKKNNWLQQSTDVALKQTKKKR